MSIASDRIDRIRKRLGQDAKIGLIGISRSKTRIEEKNNGDRNIVSIATTDGVDCEEEVIVPSGIDWGYYNTNRANFMDHRYETSYHVGSMRSIRLESLGSVSGWVNRSMVFRGMRSPHADDLWTIATSVGIGCSIGYHDAEYREMERGDPEHYAEAKSIVGWCKGLELSYTAFPCNAGCRSGIVSDGMDEKVMAGLDTLLTKGQIKVESAVAVGFPHDPTRVVVGLSAPPARKLRPLTVFVT